MGTQRWFPIKRYLTLMSQYRIVIHYSNRRRGLTNLNTFKGRSVIEGKRTVKNVIVYDPGGEVRTWLTRLTIVVVPGLVRDEKSSTPFLSKRTKRDIFGWSVNYVKKWRKISLNSVPSQTNRSSNEFSPLRRLRIRNIRLSRGSNDWHVERVLTWTVR